MVQTPTPRTRAFQCYAWCCAAVLILTACSSVPRETVESITAREQVLLQATSAFGVIYEPEEKAAVTWTDRGTLLLTPTTLYFVAGSTRSLSYAMITDASVRTLPDMLGFVHGRERDNLLSIKISRPVCQTGCVFNLVDNPELATRAAEIIQAGRIEVDPFGRADGPGPVWLVAGVRNSRFWWGETPAYLEVNAPERKRQLETVFCERLDCRGSGTSVAAYGAGLRAVLVDSPAAGYQFRPLSGMRLNQRAELDTHTLAGLLQSEDPSVRALLVSDVTAITLRERVSADYEISVEVTIHSFVDYFDLAPLKDGRYFWNDYVITRTLDEWLVIDSEGFAAILDRAARQTGCRVVAELGSPGADRPAACAEHRSNAYAGRRAPQPEV